MQSSSNHAGSSASQKRRWPTRLSLASTLLLGILACTLSVPRDVGVHEWWNGRGPVVPHDSFPSDCSTCHTGEGWTTLRADFSFDHAAETGVELEGAHKSAECLRCHNDRGPVASFAARGCAGCHENVHRGQLGSNCEDCHNQTDWRPSGEVTRHSGTGFPLIGAHAATACWRCHPGAEHGDYVRTDNECATCHTDDLARATSPDHLANGWVESCDRCHIPTTWIGAGFNHATFPLTGRHRQADCSQCHTSGFAGTPDQCSDCHLAEYQATTSPGHQSAGFPTTCESCHNTTSWLGASFAHTTWPLTGRHAQADCSQCHIGNVYAGTPNNCVDCHLSEYQSTTNPNHTAAGFPTSCDTCHTTSTWLGANFSHSFPITSGEHRNFNCSDCHLTPNNYMQFSCTHCHDHRQSEMDDKHEDVGGYSWSSPACYSCHPNGRK